MTTRFSLLRRKLLAAVVLAPGATLPSLPAFAAPVGAQPATEAVKRLEQRTGGRLGLALLDAQGSTLLEHRADERFPFCSTFKMMLTACILRRNAADASLMSRHIDFDKRVLIGHSPVVEKHVGQGMSVEELCAAAMEYSDNAAANLLLDLIGGPAALTTFARGIGDEKFLLVRRETELGSAIPGDERDTTTPQAMAQSLQRLILGDALPAPQRDQLLRWMRANQTGAKRIRAGLPSDWLVADKTGSGDYGTTNDIAVLHRPGKTPLVLVIYFTQKQKDAPLRDEVLAAAAKIVAANFP